ncbi:hypothetical protein A8C56_14845 [Niabella ginsenosidivorans]|uniref:Uncharacterized protein n=1 Tax=Niabella ginsenosidivorans TaxID=1176587 RepID=A0A1A9I4V2_9BACT|nr:hypothetical protein [Niabella ginsenosidivorans]ANH82079.1 hypothetical protein A8C56_14845 [Niabella ginsenosidivorans]
MKSIFIIACTLILFAGGLKAASQAPCKEKKNNSWVTETGPRTNPYTIIRLYDEQHKQLLEIVMNGYRLKTNPAMIKRLSRLAKAANADDIAFIAGILRISECRVSAVKKAGAQQGYCKN